MNDAFFEEHKREVLPLHRQPETLPDRCWVSKDWPGFGLSAHEDETTAAELDAHNGVDAPHVVAEYIKVTPRVVAAFDAEARCEDLKRRLFQAQIEGGWICPQPSDHDMEALSILRWVATQRACISACAEKEKIGAEYAPCVSCKARNILARIEGRTP